MNKHLKRLIGVALSIMLMFTMGTTAFAAEGDTTAVEDGKYQLNEITSSLGMFHIVEGSAFLVVKGEDATLTLDSSDANRYHQIFMGKYEEITEENKDSIGIEGTVIDAENNIIRYEIPLKTATLSEPQYFVLRYLAGYSEDHDNDWYKAKKGDYYLTLGALTPVQEPQELSISGATKTVKFKKLKKKAQYTTKVAVTGAMTEVTYSKEGGAKKLTIDAKSGKIKVAKKTKKGTYKIEVKATAAASDKYLEGSATKVIKVKVK